MAGFIKVAEISEVDEGELTAIEVEGEPVCLTKYEGVVYAFTDNCTHISGPLNEGELKGYVLECPWHFAQFDIRSGRVLRGPARQDLYTYPVKIENDAIYIGMPDEE